MHSFIHSTCITVSKFNTNFILVRIRGYKHWAGSWTTPCNESSISLPSTDTFSLDNSHEWCRFVSSKLINLAKGWGKTWHFKMEFAWTWIIFRGLLLNVGRWLTGSAYIVQGIVGTLCHVSNMSESTVSVRKLQMNFTSVQCSKSDK